MTIEDKEDHKFFLLPVDSLSFLTILPATQVEIGGLRHRRQIATVPHLLPLSPISQIATLPAPRRRCGRTADAAATYRRLAAAVTCCCSVQRHHLAVQHLTAQGACSESPSFLRHTDSGNRALDLLA
ncbi:hypothetical protein AAHA92_17928 [Salvia divinorum]|uniref:Uncharacterized protein n=1 Tax=Salvia divinorum TaxID=28513 RepID=A0ABD1H105_SALDI